MQVWEFYLNGSSIGRGDRPSDWTRLGDLGLWSRVLLKRGETYRWVLFIPGHGPDYPVLEAKRVSSGQSLGPME